MRAALATLAALAVLAAVGCGKPDEVSRRDGRALIDAQERIGDALEIEETMRTDPAAAKRLRARVQKIVSSGSFEGSRPDEFGIAMLGELRRFAPSLVLERNSDVYALDKPASRAFLRYATTDAVRALAPAVARETTRIGHVVDKADAGADTRVPGLQAGGSDDATVSTYLRGVEGDLRPRYPGQARKLAAVRGDL